MQLRLRRSQKTSGLLSKAAVFVIEARAQLKHEEMENIRKYNLGKEVIYASQTAQASAEKAQAGEGLFKTLVAVAVNRLSLVITIDSLTRGQVIEGKDLNEIIMAENALMAACQNLKTYLEAAATFDGREAVVDV